MMESLPKTPSSTSATKAGRYGLAWWTLAFALFCGGILRLVWIEDMEWKKDERWSYRMSQEVGRTLPWPSTGMPTSMSFPNPGLSVWIFVAIGRIATTPTSMARAVGLLNIIGLLGFAWAVRAYIPAREREPWIWGLALQAVSPYCVRLSRKIWPPSILTPFLLLLWISHQYRQVRWGAFTWGLVGALIGQVHLSGWFVAAGLVVGTLVAECTRRLPRSRYWHWWLFGTFLGLSIAVPWARALPSSTVASTAGPAGRTVTGRLLGCLYGLATSASSAFPFQTLGLGHDSLEFEVGPNIGDFGTHVTELLGMFVVLAFVARIVARLIGAIVAPGLAWARRMITQGVGGRGDGDKSPSATDKIPAGSECALTRFYLWSTIALPGVIFMMAIDVYFYHYFFVFYPFLFVFGAMCMLPWRRALLGIVVAQALLSWAYLSYIHQKGGTNRGEYGVNYTRQGYR
jgi:hypothetical protein